MRNFEITKREVLASISIIAVMILVGILISAKITERQMDRNEVYNKAVKIDSQETFSYGIGITHTGTIFTTLSDNTISDSSPFYEDLTIDEAVNRLEKGVGTTVFWIIGTGVIVFKFYERENEWLE